MTRADDEFETILRRADEAVGELMSGNGNGKGKRPRRMPSGGHPKRQLLMQALNAWHAWKKEPHDAAKQAAFCLAVGVAIAAGLTRLTPGMRADYDQSCPQAEAEVELETLLQEAELKVIQGGGKRRSPPKRGHLALMPTGPNAPSYAERRESLTASGKYGDPDFCARYRAYTREYPALANVPSIRVYYEHYCLGKR